MLLMAAAKDRTRHAGRQARTATTIATVRSMMAATRSRRRAGGAPPAARARLTRAARTGPVMMARLRTFEPAEYG